MRRICHSDRERKNERKERKRVEARKSVSQSAIIISEGRPESSGGKLVLSWDLGTGLKWQETELHLSSPPQCPSSMRERGADLKSDE